MNINLNKSSAALYDDRSPYKNDHNAYSVGQFANGNVYIVADSDGNVIEVRLGETYTAAKQVVSVELAGRTPVTSQGLLKITKSDPDCEVTETIDPEYVYSCQVPGCTHSPCVDNMAYPPKPILVGATINREYTKYDEDALMRLYTVQKRYYKTGNEAVFNDDEELAVNCEFEAR